MSNLENKIIFLHFFSKTAFCIEKNAIFAFQMN